MSAPAGKGLSVREFARRDGCNDKLVRRAITAGKLKPFPDGSLDPLLVGSDWRKTNRRADKLRTPGADTGKVSAPRTKVSADSSADLEDGDGVDPAISDEVDDIVRRMLDGAIVSTAAAECVKENALALKHTLDARKKSGELIDLETARTVLFEAARGQRDAWLNFPTRVGPLMAADLGVEAGPLIEALTAHVHQHLAELGEPEADFAADSEGGA